MEKLCNSQKRKGGPRTKTKRGKLITRINGENYTGGPEVPLLRAHTQRDRKAGIVK